MTVTRNTTNPFAVQHEAILAEIAEIFVQLPELRQRQALAFMRQLQAEADTDRRLELSGWRASRRWACPDVRLMPCGTAPVPSERPAIFASLPRWI
jgi:hypothetical protein